MPRSWMGFGILSSGMPYSFSVNGQPARRIWDGMIASGGTMSGMRSLVRTTNERPPLSPRDKPKMCIRDRVQDFAKEKRFSFCKLSE